MRVLSFKLNPFKGRKKPSPPGEKLLSFTGSPTKRERRHLPTLNLKGFRRFSPKRLSSRGKKIAVVGAVVLMLAALFPLSSPGQAIIASASQRELPIYSVQKDSKVVSLSFDAAWGNVSLRTYL